MFFNKYLYENKIPCSYKNLINNDIKKSFNYYLHLPKYFNLKKLYSKYSCKHENALFIDKGWYMHLNERKYLMNKIINLGLIIEFLINFNLKENATKIIKELNNCYFNLEYERLINLMNEYRTAYTIKNKKNIKTGKFEIIKEYDIAKRDKLLMFIEHKEHDIIDVASQPLKAFTINYYPFGYFLLRYEEPQFEEKINQVINCFVDKKSLINKSDYFFFYGEIKENFGIVFKLFKLPSFIYFRN